MPRRTKIWIGVRKDGVYGYVVFADIPGGPEMMLADFLPEYKEQAHSFKNGVVRGLEMAAELVPIALRVEARSKM